MNIRGVYWGYNPLILTFDPNFHAHPTKYVLLWTPRTHGKMKVLSPQYLGYNP